MFIVKETLAYSKDINDVLLSYLKEKEYHLALVNRPLDKNENGELIVPISDDEVTEGHRKIREYLYSTKSDPIFFRSQRDQATIEEWKAEVIKIQQDWQ